MEKEKMKNEVMSVFPTPVVKTPLGRGFTKLETDCFQNIPMYKDPNHGMTNYRSKDYYLFDTFAEELKDIKKFCEYHLKQYMEEIEGVDTNLAGLRITQSWLNKNKPNESHPSHFHPNSYLSGVFYINCLPNDNIGITNRLEGMYNTMIFPIKNSTAWNANAVKVGVEEGDLVLFPSWVLHFVNLNETTNKDRISLAFNTFPIGELGEYHYGSHLKL